jgi:hypothetical protein
MVFAVEASKEGKARVWNKDRVLSRELGVIIGQQTLRGWCSRGQHKY